MKKLFIILILFVVVVPVFADEEESEGNWLSSWILDALRDFFEWITEFFQEAGFYLIESILAFIPDNAVMDGSSILYYLEVANVWLPVDYATTLMFSYLTFLAGFITVKMVLKLIPWIG